MTRLRLLAAVAGVAAVAGAGAVRAAPTTVDLAPVAVGLGGTVAAATLTSYGAKGMHVLDYQHDGRSALSLELGNDGRLPLTVTGLDLPAAVAPLLSLTEVRGLPLHLAPGERGTVTATGVLGNCRYTHERQVELREELLLEVRVLGTTTVRAVPLDRPVLVHSPMIVGCPDRKLDRQADNRTELTRSS